MGRSIRFPSSRTLFTPTRRSAAQAATGPPPSSGTDTGPSTSSDHAVGQDAGEPE
jgi:hypothetical protein